jgi:hypothetical protein
MDDSKQPTNFVAYPRGEARYSSPEKLAALGEGYFGISSAFVLNLILGGATMVACIALRGYAPWALVTAAGVLITGLATGFLSYTHLTQIGYAMDWKASAPRVLSIIIGLTAPTCLSVIAFAWVQTIAGREIREFGVKQGFFGLTRMSIVRRMRELAVVEPPVMQFIDFAKPGSLE